MDVVWVEIPEVLRLCVQGHLLKEMYQGWCWLVLCQPDLTPIRLACGEPMGAFNVEEPSSPWTVLALVRWSCVV